jgi:hypothetical protein
MTRSAKTRVAGLVAGFGFGAFGYVSFNMGQQFLGAVLGFAGLYSAVAAFIRVRARPSAPEQLPAQRGTAGSAQHQSKVRR